MSKTKILAAVIAILTLAIVLFNWPAPTPSETVQIESIEPQAATLIPAKPIPPPPEVSGPPIVSVSSDSELPAEVDRISELFEPYGTELSFIETVTYAGRVEWVNGRPAYLGDYAAHYQTSKHFIARSLRGMGNYLSDVVSKGEKFNVYKKDRPIEFHCIVDLSRLKLWLYCHDRESDSKILLKTYRVCAGKLDASRKSGSLTPIGTFAIGKEFAVYQEGVKGNFKNEPCEMISVYGKRWIPLGREISGCSSSCKGLGLHGVPWKGLTDSASLQEQRSCIGHYETEGSIRLLTEDIEEIYAIIVSKPAYLHCVKDFIDAQIPGREG